MRRGTMLRWTALAIGVLLFAATLWYIDVPAAVAAVAHLGLALPLALAVSGSWQLARTIAWAACFPEPRTVTFARLARVRLAAEAFSYLTVRGVAGEPLKVLLLADRVNARDATAAVALERIAYLVGTIVIIGIGSLVAIATLPLTHGWFRVFRAFAIATAIVTVLSIVVITGRGTYLHSWLNGIDRRTGWSLASGRVGRFAIAVERQMLDLVRHRPRRLALLLSTTVVSYVCMALEAWIILRGAGVPVSSVGALTVETFSRVASFASAFIPANLGALEASSLAAVAAIGTGGGAVLALVRRIRGLFWAALGLAIYPRQSRPVRKDARNPQPDGRGGPGATLMYFPEDPAVSLPPTARLAGLPVCERIVRAAFRAGYARVLVRVSGAGPRCALRSALHGIHGVQFVEDHAWRGALSMLREEASVTIVGAGTVVSAELLASAELLSASPGTPADVPAGVDWRESGVIRMTVPDAADPRRALEALAERRRRGAPLPSGEDVSRGRAKLALRFETAADLAGAERTIRRSSFKDTDAAIARFNRRLSLPISVALIRTPITANQISIAVAAMGFYAAWLFGTGRYFAGVLAGFVSLAASILDGCDGEVARLKFQESALGCWVETIGDYAYYLAIFAGLSIGAVRQTGIEAFYWIGAAATGGALLSFALLIFLRSRITAGRPEKLHAIARERLTAQPTLWSRVLWRVSFVATRAAMPYGIVAFALAGALPAVVVLAAIGANIYWVSLLVKLRDLLGGGEGQRVAA